LSPIKIAGAERNVIASEAKRHCERSETSLRAKRNVIASEAKQKKATPVYRDGMTLKVSQIFGWINPVRRYRPEVSMNNLQIA
jgi:hypothetical protein